MELFMMNCELLAACSALGYLEEDKYYKEPDCLDTIKCLIHYLQQEDSTCTVRIQLNAAHIVINDLIPILVQYPTDDQLFSAVLRLLVNITKPVTLCLGNNVPTDVNSHYQFMSLLSANQEQKDAFSDSKIWAILAKKAYKILEKSLDERDRDDNKCLEAILLLVRNLLYTPGTSEDENKTADDISAHDKLVIAMHIVGFDNLLAYIAGSQKEKQWCLHVLEIISLMVKEHEAESIAKVGVKSTQEERQKMGDELVQLRAKENKKKSAMKLDSRHSRFGSTFVAKGIGALNAENNIILHKSVQKSAQYHFDDGKSKLSKAKNRRPLIDTTVKRHSTLQVRKVIREFCVEFLNNSYNTVMKNALGLITAEKSDEHDESYFFWVMNFFMEFNRCNGCKVELVSETIQLSLLHFINVSIINYYEMMVTSKEYKTWGRRVHLALRCYMELLLTFQEMKTSNEPRVVESVSVLMNTLFYVVEYREIFLLLLRKFDERKQTRGFLRDVVCSAHLFIKMFQAYCGDSSIVVEKTMKVKRKEPKKTKWNDIETEVTESFKNSSERSDCDFSYLSDVDDDELIGIIRTKLQEFMLEKKFEAAAKLLSEVQDNYQHLTEFGSDGTVEGNVNLLKQIYVDFSEYQNEVSEEPNPKRRTKEVQYSFDDYIKKMADAKIVSAYMVLFSEFEHNTAKVNHYVVTMLHRVAHDLSMYGLLFNASAFKTMQTIIGSSALDPTTKEMKRFSYWVLERFFEHLPNNPKLFVEIMVKKNSLAEVTEMTEGYGTYSSGKTTGRWTEAEKAELKDLFYKFNNGEDNVVDLILANITDERKTRKQICNQLVDLNLVSDVSQLKTSKGKQKVWRQNHIEELQRLYEEFKDTNDVLGQIKSHLTTKRSRESIIDKILELKLVESRRDLYKKRNAKIKTHEGPVVHIGGADSSDEEEETVITSVEDQVKELHDLGYSNLLNWLRENLQQALEDRLEDGETLQPIPLVAFTKDQETGLGSSSFKTLLLSLKIQRPSDQEMFWRIPTSLTKEEITSSIRLIGGQHKRKRSESDEASESANKIPKHVEL